MQSTPVPRLRRILLPLLALPLVAGAGTILARDAAPTAPGASPRGAPARVRLHVAASDRRAAGAFTPAVPTVTIVDLNSGPHVDRAQCLTASVGAGAAFECGDLRQVHGVPGVRVRGRVRAPVLLYNSKYAHPRQTVYADVGLPAGATVPDSVIVTMTRPDGTVLWRNGFRGIDWVPGGPARRVAAQWDASGTGGTRISGYAWQVSTLYAGALYSTPLIHAPIAVVDRSDSPYGTGWWVAGLEELKYVSSVRWLWVGGDGSTRLYKNTGTPGVFSVDSISRPDTLRAVAVGTETHHYRSLPGGTTVWFNAQGQHYKTVNRLGETTTFNYSGSRLTSIVYPPNRDGFSHAHYFSYNTAGRLLTVSTRTVTTDMRGVILDYALGDGRVTSIRDSDGATIEFGYDPGSPALIASRKDRRGTVVRYGYDHAWKLTSIKVPLAAGDTIVSRIFSTEMRGLRGNSVPVDHAYTWFNGPRNDVNDYTSIWLTRWGAPQRIVNALGHETVLTRADPNFRALVTQMVAPSGLVTRAWYNSRGNVDSTAVINGVGDGRDAVTRYTYDAVWRDFTTQSTGPEGEVTRMAYDPQTGNRLWQQAGSDATRVTFQYYTDPAETGSLPGHIRSMTLPAINGVTAVEKYEYDAMGNLSATVSPRNFRTVLHNDVLGRTWKTESPIEGTAVMVQENTFYPNTDLVEYSRSIGPAMNGVAQQTLVVRTQYDAAGSPRIVERWSEPEFDAARPVGHVVTEYRYDALGRRVAEIAPDGKVDSTFYDHAGNVVRLRSRRHAEFEAANPAGAAYVTMEYDALNRLSVRRTPAVRYAERQDGFGIRFYNRSNSEEIKYYPRYPNDGGTGYRIAGDTARFEYDAMGNMIRAHNADALVHRRYHPNGLLATDSLYLRTTTGTDFTQHKYGLEYLYDRSGRRTELRHPQQLAPSATQNRQTYGYTADGSLEWTTDLLGNFFRYGYNVRHELESLQFPSSGLEQFGYDPDGNLTLHSASNGTVGWLRSATLTYDGRGKLKSTRNQYGSRDTMTATYSGLGHVATSTVVTRAQEAQALGCAVTSVRITTSERLYHDALGNLHRTDNSRTMSTPGCGESWSNESPAQIQRYEAATGRLSWSAPQETTTMRDSSWYDASGNVVFQANPRAAWVQNGALTERASYYAADGTLRAADARSIVITGEIGGEYRMAFEEYRYDALGRRVWVRARRYCEKLPNGAYSECNIDKVRRTVWDGGQELWEIQMPGGDGSPHLENDVAQLPALALQQPNGSGAPADPMPYFGRVAFAHGLSTDQPLSMVRIGYGDQLNQSTDPTQTNKPATPRWLPPFAVIPLWNARGQADLGTFADGTTRKCVLDAQGATRCIYLGWPGWWPAYQRPSFGTTFWHGTLLEDKKDQTGTYFRRNRYYDPSTGRFTQEDPIGLAGGLNAYGFAAGDPVNYADPYGLCPARLKRNGRCPGGLDDDEEWDKVQGAINTLRPGAERNRLQRMLERGRIVRVQQTRNGTPAIANVGRGRRSNIEVADGFFSGDEPGYKTGYDTPGERGWALGHELGHFVQWEEGRLISEIGNPAVRSSRGRIRALMEAQAVAENTTLQRDADIMGCRLATAPGIWAHKC